MPNGNYWKDRFKQLEAAQNRKGADTYLEIEKQYRQAQKEIEGKINTWYQRFATNNNVSMAEARRMLRDKELAELKWNVKEYIKQGQANAFNGQWIKELENASARFHISRLEALKLQTQQSLELMFGNQLDSIDTAMKRIYLDGYYHTAYELQKGFRIGWDIAGLDQRKIKKVISKPWAVDGRNFSNRIWGNKEKLISEIHREITQDIMLGRDPQKAIDNISKKMNTSKINAGRLIMTEEAYFSSVAQKDCFYDLGVEQYEIVATLDSHTSDICQNLDGQVFPMKDFEPGVTAPPFHVYCRSTTVPYFEEDFGQIGKRAARGDHGKTYYVPANMTYKEWKESFVGRSRLQETKSDGTMNYNARTKEQLEKTANDIKTEITDYSSNPSKWSGTIHTQQTLIDGEAVGTKEWSCDISIMDTVDDGVVWHEILHSCSASYYDPMVFVANRRIEEASVEFLKQQICKERNIASLPSYAEYTIILEALNNKFQFGTDMEFAKELFNIPLPERYQWLEDKVGDALRALNAEFEDYNDVIGFVKNLRGDFDGTFR